MRAILANMGGDVGYSGADIGRCWELGTEYREGIFGVKEVM